jgi:hypothetical protein
MQGDQEGEIQLLHEGTGSQVTSVETATAGSQAEDLVRTEMTWKGPVPHCLGVLEGPTHVNICIRV